MKKSFTLLETLVAIYVLLVGMVGAMTLTQQNIATGAIFKNQLIAANLAQEGIELVRNKRDANFLTALNDPNGAYAWPEDPNQRNEDGIVSVCSEANGGCRLDDNYDPAQEAIVFVSCNADGASCKPLQQDPATGVFGYSGGVASIFTRAIVVVKQSYVATDPLLRDRDDWEVRSIVSWPGRFSSPSNVEERAVLTPWLF